MELARLPRKEFQMTGFLERRRGISLTTLGIAGLAMLGLLLAAFVATHGADSLRAAGLNGSPPPNSGAFKGFIDQMSQNALWIIGTSVGLGLLIIGGLFLFGHSRAQDYAAKVAMGVAIIILAPGIGA
jgi:hypothetical protein